MKSFKWFTLVGILTLLFPVSSTLLADDSDQATVQHNPQIIYEVKHDVSRPLRDIAPKPVRAGVKRAIRNERIPRPMGKPGIDTVLQSWMGPQNIPAPIVNVSGINFPGVDCNCAPPDTNGDVGPNHYVQTVNTGFQIFDKSGGTVQAAMANNTLFDGFGGACEVNNDGDPVFIYDSIADRWVFSQFSLTTPFLECVAVSTSPDPTGTYNRYSFNYGNIELPDYPKMAVWPDAYYTTYNIFDNGAIFSGAKVCAMDRTKMLAGLAATQQCFDTSTTFGGLLGSDLDGPTLPPVGQPNTVVGLGSTNSLIATWKFHVDFVTPGNTTFDGPHEIAVAAYSELCSAFFRGQCVPQLGTNQKLESLGDRVMYRAAYRNFGDHESLLVSHSVDAAGVGGVRWYEFRNVMNTTPTVFQSGTFAPDTDWRWMPSIAMDGDGNIAVGYSKSSAAIHPQIKYSGRLATDPLGTLPQGEGTIFDGPGSQGGGLARWGDYSATSIDPADDCTFWITNEYLPANGSFNWNTRIGSFKFDTCGGGGGGCDQTANQTGTITARNKTVSGDLTPAFTIAGADATSGNVSWTLGGTTDLTACASIRLESPDGSRTTLKAAGSPDPGSADVLSFYQAEGPGTYKILLTEKRQCGSGQQNATLDNTAMNVQSSTPCP